MREMGFGQCAYSRRSLRPRRPDAENETEQDHRPDQGIA
jgi:hypothetical protein